MYLAITSIKSPNYDYYRTGQGEVSRFDCGQFRKAIACGGVLPKISLEHQRETTEPFFKVCKKFTCPSCYLSAVGQSAGRITSRITKLAIKYRNRKVPIGRKKHIVFSPPPGVYGANALADGGKAIYAKVEQLQRFAAKDGFFAGVNILHMERQQDGKWVPGEHVHFFGYGYFMPFDEFFVETGWTYKQIEDNGPRDCYATVYYQLTHCANFISLKTGRAAKNFRYVGAFHDKVSQRVVYPSTLEPVLCKECKVPKHEYAPALDKAGAPCLDVNYDLDKGEYFRVVKHEDWVIKTKGLVKRRKRAKDEVIRSESPSWNRLRRSGSAVHESNEAYDYDTKQWLGFPYGSDFHKEYLERKRDGEKDESSI